MQIKIFNAFFLTAMIGLATTAQAGKYKAIDVTDGGSITGSVLSGDAVAETKTYTISKDPEICGQGTRDVNFVRINDGKLLDAVVYLEKVSTGKPFADGLASLEIDQKGCAFSPLMGVIENKGELTALNQDPTLHNIHVYELIGNARRTLMNVSQPNQGDTVTKAIKVRKGNGLKIECDAHDFMHAFVFVTKNPYYAVVDENGAFNIGDIPAGTYKISVWHGKLGQIAGGEVVVTAGGETSIDLSY
jgi:Polysaccharide lyase family 4, domain II